MKILVFSDSHGQIFAMKDVLTRIGEQMEAVFFLGDHDVDALYLAKHYPNLPFYVVRGNNDYEADTPFSRTVAIGGVVFYLTHGHKEGVYASYQNLLYAAEEAGASVAIFGHTHRMEQVQCGDILLLNPGSISLPRDSHHPSFAILHIEENRVQATHMQYYGVGKFLPRK